MWKTISESILILSVALGLFFSFTMFEVFAWFNGREPGDARYLKSELIVVSVGLVVGFLAGVILDAYAYRTSRLVPSPVIWSLLFTGIGLFCIVRIISQAAALY